MDCFAPMSNACLQEYLLYECKGAQLRKSSGIMDSSNQAKFAIKYFFPSKLTENVSSDDICQPLLKSKEGGRVIMAAKPLALF